MLSLASVDLLLLQPQWNGEVHVLSTGQGTGRHLIALGAEEVFEITDQDSKSISQIDAWISHSKSWIFGYISYDFKNKLERLTSRQHHPTASALLRFVKPMVVLEWIHDSWQVLHNTSSIDDASILRSVDYNRVSNYKSSGIELKPVVSEEQYKEDIALLKTRIQRGDIYEINYCQEFSAHHEMKDPYGFWKALYEKTRAPFAAYIRHQSLHVMCASPERYIQKAADKLISQPIKGTIRRGRTSEEDEDLKKALQSSEKERSENVMIVDLVRNDFSQVATKGSVEVTELCGIHTFNTVHHMISTVACTLKADVKFGDILKASFPMGSMTGAPKVSAMQWIENTEKSRRGIYSGSIGYITPEGDFDFNVVIRSLIYQEQNHYLSCSVGSAITSLCDAEKEYEECLLKAAAIRNTL